MHLTGPTLAGYFLEEVLAYLLRTCGYDLIVPHGQDDKELVARGGMLYARGRGSDHQVDVLGDLHWLPAFTLPLRLIVEAKCLDSNVGIRTVREAVAIMMDVNSKYGRVELKPTVFGNRETQPTPRYQYVYAIFSAEGFSDSAVNLAYAHNISLISMSRLGLDTLLETVRNSAENIANHELPRGVLEKGLVKTLRNYLRSELNTYPPGYSNEGHEQEFRTIEELLSPLDEVVRETRIIDEVYLGMARGPFILVLYPDNRTIFRRAIRRKPSHEVSIHYREQPDNEDWWIRPASQEGLPDYRLRFRLPRLLADWIFGAEYDDAENRAIQVKEQYFAETNIYTYDVENRIHRIFTLKFDRRNL